MTQDSGGRPRRYGAPEGRSERTERIVRRVFPDGSVVDSEPIEINSSGNSLTFEGIISTFIGPTDPRGTTRRVLTRTVVVEASPWTDVTPEETT